jgi:hypothetical protein
MGIDPLRPLLQPRASTKITSEQYRIAIKKLGLSQVRAARFFGVSDRQGQRMATGEVEIPPPIQYLLILMLKYKIEPGVLNENFTKDGKGGIIKLALH